MTDYTSLLTSNVERRRDYGSDVESRAYNVLTATSDDMNVLSATASKTWLEGPAQSLSDIAYKQTGLDVSPWAFLSPAYTMGQILSQRDEIEARQNELEMSKEDWENSKYYRDGLKYENGLKPYQAELLTRRYDELRTLNSIINNKRDSGWLTAGQFGVGFVTSALDPVNLAASVVPVGRVLTPLLRSRSALTASTALTRSTGFFRGAAYGAFEGAVGTALVEPLVYAGAASNQRDYTMYDALENIAFGAAIGTVAGGTIGAVERRIEIKSARQAKDPAKVLADIDPQGFNAQLRTALAQDLEGRPVDVSAVINTADGLSRNRVYQAKLYNDQVNAVLGKLSKNEDVTWKDLEGVLDESTLRQLDQMAPTVKPIDVELKGNLSADGQKFVDDYNQAYLENDIERMDAAYSRLPDEDKAAIEGSLSSKVALTNDVVANAVKASAKAFNDPQTRLTQVQQRLDTINVKIDDVQARISQALQRNAPTKELNDELKGLKQEKANLNAEVAQGVASTELAARTKPDFQQSTGALTEPDVTIKQQDIDADEEILMNIGAISKEDLEVLEDIAREQLSVEQMPEAMEIFKACLIGDR